LCDLVGNLIFDERNFEIVFLIFAFFCLLFLCKKKNEYDIIRVLLSFAYSLVKRKNKYDIIRVLLSFAYFLYAKRRMNMILLEYCFLLPTFFMQKEE